MISHSIIQLVDHYGYLIFFLAFCLGPFGIPVPNEITILTGSILSNSGILNPWMIYTHILAGLLTAITCTFFVGKIFGDYILAGLHLLDTRSITFLIIAVGILITTKRYESEFLKSALLNEPVRE